MKLCHLGLLVFRSLIALTGKSTIQKAFFNQNSDHESTSFIGKDQEHYTQPANWPRRLYIRFTPRQPDVPLYMYFSLGWYVDTAGEMQQHQDPKMNETSHSLWLQAGGQIPVFFLNADCILVIIYMDCFFFACPISQVVSAWCLRFQSSGYILHW